MPKQMIGLVTIGQTPRPDIVSDFEAIWQGHFRLEQYGALDGVTPADKELLMPIAGEEVLFVRFADGTTTDVSKARLTPFVSRKIQEAAADGAAGIIVLCTGEFQGLPLDIPYILPCQLLSDQVTTLLPPGSGLTILLPTEAQIPEATLRWTLKGYNVKKVLAQSPFADQNQRDAMGRELSANPVILSTDALIADCFGFSAGFAAWAKSYFPGPVFVPRTQVAEYVLQQFQSI